MENKLQKIFRSTNFLHFVQKLLSFVLTKKKKIRFESVSFFRDSTGKSLQSGPRTRFRDEVLGVHPDIDMSMLYSPFAHVYCSECSDYQLNFFKVPITTKV